MTFHNAVNFYEVWMTAEFSNVWGLILCLNVKRNKFCQHLRCLLIYCFRISHEFWWLFWCVKKLKNTQIFLFSEVAIILLAMTCVFKIISLDNLWGHVLGHFYRHVIGHLRLHVLRLYITNIYTNVLHIQEKWKRWDESDLATMGKVEHLERILSKSSNLVYFWFLIFFFFFFGMWANSLFVWHSRECDGHFRKRYSHADCETGCFVKDILAIQ